MSNKYVVLFLFICQFLVLSCGESYVFEKTYEIDKGEWQYENKLAYTFEISDTTQIYDLILAVGHSVDYSYQNCYVKIYTEFPSGEKTDYLLSVDLADGIGKWQGDCNGSICTTIFDIRKQFYFTDIGKHTITIEQYMRRNPLKGIESLAVKLQEVEVENAKQ